MTLIRRDYAGSEVLKIWPDLKDKISELFQGLDCPIRPSLLHGDLWSGNMGQVDREAGVDDTNGTCQLNSSKSVCFSQ